MIRKVIIRNYVNKDFPEKNLNLSDDEKEERLKEFGFEKDDKKYKFNPSKFSRKLRSHSKIKLLKNNEFTIYNYRRGVYELDCEETLKKLIKHALNLVADMWNPYYASVALQAIRTDTLEIVEAFNSGNFINLKNGILDLKTLTLSPHSPDYLSTIQLPFNYEKALPTPVFDKYLDDTTCGDEELKRVLQELLGYCLCNSTAAEKAFFLSGSGCNGKSVFAKLIEMIVGEGNYSSTSLSALSGSFGLASLLNSNVNVAAENNSGRVNSEIFKAIVSGDVVEVNRKYREALSCQLHCKLVLLFNELPVSSDLSHGFFRKLMIIPFKHTVPKEKIDVELIDKLQKELPGIFYWAVQGLVRLRKNQYQFSPCKLCDDALEQYKRSLNPSAAFFEECYKIEQGYEIRKSEIYQNFSRYCYDNSLESINCQAFWKGLKAHFSDKGYNFRIKRKKGYDFIEGIHLK